MAFLKFRKLPCLPSSPTAGTMYLMSKLLLLTLFSAVFCLVVYHDTVNMSHFKGLITSGLSRSKKQVYQNHVHFFLFTCVWMLVGQVIGLWAIIMEFVPVMVAYTFIIGAGLVFQLLGAWQSHDNDVLYGQLIGAVPFPIMIVLILTFAHYTKKSQSHLASLPLYRRTVVESRRQSLAEIIDGDITRPRVDSIDSYNPQGKMAVKSAGLTLDVPVFK
ncbi:hypothetical protein HDE_04864 [Halotydeus destructor]|nr:hypothetical protein HDE_04864 [Halotydeus destructor]